MLVQVSNIEEICKCIFKHIAINSSDLFSHTVEYKNNREAKFRRWALGFLWESSGEKEFSLFGGL